MASVSMAASFLGGAVVSAPIISHRKLVISNSANSNTVKARCEKKGEESSNWNGRREVVFAAITATACSVAGMALADIPKRGTPEARKAFSPVCVATPGTASTYLALNSQKKHSDSKSIIFIRVGIRRATAI